MGPEHVREILYQLAVSAVPLLAAVIFHEVAHGVVALRLGDDTALRMGRLTLNPLPHIDPFGTVLLPGILLLLGAPVFGYARPVPVDYRNLRDPRRGMVLVALAGPLMNIALATLCALLVHALLGYLGGVGDTSSDSTKLFASAVVFPLAKIAYTAVTINVVLAVFNMLPIPPLDGGRVLTGLLPYQQARWVASLEPFGMLIVMGLLMTNALSHIIGVPIALVLHALGMRG